MMYVFERLLCIFFPSSLEISDVEGKEPLCLHYIFITYWNFRQRYHPKIFPHCHWTHHEEWPRTKQKEKMISIRSLTKSGCVSFRLALSSTDFQGERHLRIEPKNTILLKNYRDMKRSVDANSVVISSFCAQVTFDQRLYGRGHLSREGTGAYTKIDFPLADI